MIGDLGRYLFWVKLRRFAQPSAPRALERVSRIGAEVQWKLDRGRRELMAEELRRSFAGHPWPREEIDRVSREAYRLQVRCLAEELLLGKLTSENVERFMVFENREHLDAALRRNRGVVLVFPHAGAIMLLIALLSLSGYDFTQVAARGFPPAVRQHRGDMRPTWLNVQARSARETSEDHLPAHFHGMDAPPRQLYRSLEKNGIIAIAFDGRGGSKFERVRYLGRTSLLSSGPWRLAASTNAAIVPAFCLGISDEPHRLVFAPALEPDQELPLAARALDLLERALRDSIEPWLETHPEHYARWLLHCREHANMDDHPLFPIS